MIAGDGDGGVPALNARRLPARVERRCPEVWNAVQYIKIEPCRVTTLDRE